MGLYFCRRASPFSRCRRPRRAEAAAGSAHAKRCSPPRLLVAAGDCRAVRVARKAAKELRELGIRHPTIYIITIYNRQRDLLERLVAKEPALRGACDCQVRRSSARPRRSDGGRAAGSVAGGMLGRFGGRGASAAPTRHHEWTRRCCRLMPARATRPTRSSCPQCATPSAAARIST